MATNPEEQGAEAPCPTGTPVYGVRFRQPLPWGLPVDTVNPHQPLVDADLGTVLTMLTTAIAGS